MWSFFRSMVKEAMEDHLPDTVIFRFLPAEQAFIFRRSLYDIDFTVKTDEDMSYRESLEQIWRRKRAAESLHEMLRKVDPVSAEEIHANNIKRVIRALEYFQQTGRTHLRSQSSGNGRKQPPTTAPILCSMPPGLVLYERIDRRVDEMLENGLVEEVERLRDLGCTREHGFHAGTWLQGNPGLAGWRDQLTRKPWRS